MAWMGGMGEVGGRPKMEGYIYVADSHCDTAETNTTITTIQLIQQWKAIILK